MGRPTLPSQYVATRLDASRRDLLGLAGGWPRRYPMLLDSAAHGPLGRYCLLAVSPRRRLVLRRSAVVHDSRDGRRRGGFLDALEQQLRTTGMARAGGEWPFIGGWFVYLGYETVSEIEPRLNLPAAESPITACAWQVDNAIVHDTSTGESWYLSVSGNQAALATIEGDLERLRRPQVSAFSCKVAMCEEAPDLYLRRVERAKELIAAGEIYQANLSRWWRGSLPVDAPIAALYDQLCSDNPAPMAGLMFCENMALLSSSPERLLSIDRDRFIATRPIAGTRPRASGHAAERTMIEQLREHPKERAEHIMLIDLERNDLGRVCVPGSVEVNEYMNIETYAHVHHIVSNVRGRLREDVSPIAALRATFPGGTITGCPKFRCMQIIAELEGVGRGAYTGAIGYIGYDGRADFNILIRSLVMVDRAIELRAGAGIVADSDPQSELEETRAKARGVLKALGAAT
ncbi:MAG: aminodeoxychorismate synthase component I [Steroidobacteraceae bacterium]